MRLKLRALVLVSGCCILTFFEVHRRSSTSQPPSKVSAKSIEKGERKADLIVNDLKRKNSPSVSNEEKNKSPQKTSLEKQKDTQKDDTKAAERFQTRLKILKRRCPGWRDSPLRKNWVANKNFLINYPRRVLVCAVPKAGSTSWHSIVWAMRRKQAGLDPDLKFYTPNDTIENHHMAERLTAQEGKDLITYYEGDENMFRNPPTEKSRRLLLTRHPFARMISGWHQKFLPQSSYSDLMLQRYPRLRRYVRETDPYHRIAWKDFAEFIADTGDRTQALDYHFTPVWELCKPCQYAYTYILKAESVDQDEPWLKRRLNITDINVGRRGVPPGGSVVNSNPSENIKKYMTQLDDRARRKLYEVYRVDFEMFGYTFDFRTLESGGFE